jgi:hypothetical protein
MKKIEIALTATVTFLGAAGTAWAQNIYVPSGSVGIGTTSPTTQLHVFSSSESAATEINIEDQNAFGYPGLLNFIRSRASKTAVANGDVLGRVVSQGFDGTNFINGAGVQFDVEGTVGTNTLPSGIQFITKPSMSQTITMALTAAGSLGIGTTTPAVKLAVVGDARVGTSGTNGCLQNFAGTGLVGTCSSDARLKQNIKPLENVLQKVLALAPVTFEWNQKAAPERKFGAGTAFGLIAQQVEKIFPQLVGTDDKGFKTVSYGTELQMLVIQALKELAGQSNVKIASLEKENEKLRASLTKMESRLGALESRMARADSNESKKLARK